MARHLSEKEQTVVQFVKSTATHFFPYAKVWLFGSRARGDAQPRSDYDFALDVGDADNLTWSRFWVEVDENAPTLCGIDLVDIRRSASVLLKTKIADEGMAL